MPLGMRIQGRAISLNDGGRPGGDICRAEIAVRSRFVLELRAVGRVAVAGFLAIFVMAGANFGSFIGFGAVISLEGRLVSSSLLGCARCVPEGGAPGSHPASQGAPGFGSLCQTAPRS